MNKRKSMPRLYQVTALVIFIAGLLLVYGSLNLRYYTSMGPGPGFFPFWLSLILVFLAVLMFLQATFTKSPENASGNIFPDRDGILRIAVIPLALIAVALLLERIGFGPTIFLMNMFVMRALTKRRFLLLFVIAFISSFGIEYVFTQWLNVPLPKTDLGVFCPQFMCGE